MLFSSGGTVTFIDTFTRRHVILRFAYSRCMCSCQYITRIIDSLSDDLI